MTSFVLYVLNIFNVTSKKFLSYRKFIIIKSHFYLHSITLNAIKFNYDNFSYIQSLVTKKKGTSYICL